MNLGLKLEDVREEVLNLLGHGLEGAEVVNVVGVPAKVKVVVPPGKPVK